MPTETPSAPRGRRRDEPKQQLMSCSIICNDIDCDLADRCACVLHTGRVEMLVTPSIRIQRQYLKSRPDQYVQRPVCLTRRHP